MQWLDTSITLPPLMSGQHDSPADGLCAMEMVAYMERLPHSDKPACTCPVITTFVIVMNDLLPNSKRNELLPYLPRLVGTVSPSHEQERAEYLAWAAITIFAPAALRAAKLFEHADALANFDKSLGLQKASERAAWAARAASAESAASAAWAARAASAARAVWAASAARAASAASAESAARAARAAWAARAAVYADCFRVLDGLLLIGPQSRGFTALERQRELAVIA